MVFDPNFIRQRCSDCGKRTKDRSAKRLCSKCQLKRVSDNNRDLRNKSGKYYQKWLSGYERLISENSHKK